MPVDGWSLAASVARFGWAGGVERRDGEAHYRLAFADDDGAPFAVRLAQDELGLRVHSDDALSRAATFQLARLLSIAWPADDEGFPAVGARDPVVPFKNTATATAYFATQGVQVTPIDVEQVPQFGPTIAVQVVAAPDLSTYHGTIVPPLCLSLAKNQFFDPRR